MLADFAAKIWGNRSDLKSLRIWEKNAFVLSYKKHDKSKLKSRKDKGNFFHYSE